MLDCVLSVHDAYSIIILCKERIQQTVQRIVHKIQTLQLLTAEKESLKDLPTNFLGKIQTTKTVEYTCGIAKPSLYYCDNIFFMVL